MGTATSSATVSYTHLDVYKRQLKTLDAVAASSAETLAQIFDVGAVTAESIVEWFAQPASQRLIERLKAAGVNTSEPETETGGALLNKTFVLTGTLPTMTRGEATALILSLIHI